MKFDINPPEHVHKREKNGIVLIPEGSFTVGPW